MHFDPPIAPLVRRVAIPSAVSFCTLFLFLCSVFDRGHPCFRNFNSVIAVNVIKMKSHVNSFLDPTCEPVRISITTIDLVPSRSAAGLVGVFRNGGGLATGKSYIPVVFFDPLLHRSP